jgi:hypothetical protein
MTVLRVERLGGLAGLGSPRSRLRSRGEIALHSLSLGDRALIDALFRNPLGAAEAPLRDGFRYRISRDCNAGAETVEVPEAAVPPAVAACVKDTIV